MSRAWTFLYSIGFAIYVGWEVSQGNYDFAAYGFTLAVLSNLHEIKSMMRGDE